MNKAKQILEKHINSDDLHFIFYEKKELWQELLNALNEALSLSHVVGRSEQCAHPRDKREYIGSNMLRCKVCGKEFS